MDEYREKVRRLAVERTGEPFFNASEDHAAIIVENMFRAAEREVCILTDHLSPKVYGRDDVVMWATIFLADDSGHSLRVIMREGDLPLLETNPLYKAIKDARNVQFRVLSDASHARIQWTFLVADGDSYRFAPDKTKCEAVAAFNSVESQKLQGFFERRWNEAQPVNLDNLDVLHPSLLN